MGAGLCLVIPVANGAQWYIDPYAWLAYGSDDNPRLLILDAQSNAVTKSTAGFKINRAEDIWNTSFHGKYTRVDYSPNDALDTNNILYEIKTSYKAEQSLWNLSASYREDSTLGDEIDADTGILFEQRTREMNQIRPEIMFYIDNRTSISWNLDYSDSSYKDIGNIDNLFNYENTNNTLLIVRGVTERTKILAQLGQSYFVSERADSVPPVTGEFIGTESITINSMLGIEHKLSETINGKLFGGIRKTKSDNTIYGCVVFLGPLCLKESNVVISQDETGISYSGQLEKKYLASSMNLSFSRAVNPSSGGTETINDNAMLNISRPLSQRWHGAVLASYSTVQTVGVDYYGYNRRISWIEPRVTWQQKSIQSGWSGSLAYRYTRLKRAIESEDVERNTLNLQIRYGWSRIDIY